MSFFDLFKKKKKPIIGWQDLIEQGILNREEVLFLKKKRATEEYDKEVAGDEKSRVRVRIMPKK
jgi:hypothetical protein